jgi:hypothetical protein
VSYGDAGELLVLSRPQGGQPFWLGDAADFLDGSGVPKGGLAQYRAAGVIVDLVGSLRSPVPVRVPPWAGVSAVQGPFGPLAVHKSAFCGPFRAVFVGGRWWGRCLFPWCWMVCLSCFFMAGRGRGYMTCEGSGGLASAKGRSSPRALRWLAPSRWDTASTGWSVVSIGRLPNGWGRSSFPYRRRGQALPDFRCPQSPSMPGKFPRRRRGTAARRQ